MQGTPGCELVPELDRSKLDFVLDKGQDPRVEMYSAFGPPFRSPKVCMSGLEDRLKAADITDLFIVGLAWGFCVKYTAIDAAREGFRTYVIEEATKAGDHREQARAASRKEMQDAGVHVIGLDSKELDMVRPR